MLLNKLGGTNATTKTKKPLLFAVHESVVTKKALKEQVELNTQEKRTHKPKMM